MDAVEERCQVAMWFNAQWLLMESSWHYGISKRNGIMQTKQKWKKKTDSPLTLQYEEMLKNEKEQNLSDLKELRQNSDLPFIPKWICFLIEKRTVFFLVRGTTLSYVWFKAAEYFPSLQQKTLYQKSLILTAARIIRHSTYPHFGKDDYFLLHMPITHAPHYPNY